MSEEKSQKINFVLGLFVGMAAISVIGFFSLLVVVFSQKQPVDLAAVAAVPGEGQVIEEPLAEQPQLAPLPAINESDYVWGGANAKVEIIEYTDFECPFCSRHFDTAQQLKAEYGDKIKFVTRHFPLGFHEHAQKAAEAVECAGEQGKFWEMYAAVFNLNKAGTMSTANFKVSANQVGVNTSTFNTCLDSGKYVSKVQQQQAAGSAAGVEGTPATFINGEMISGALPFETFKQIIDQLLAE